MLLAKSIQFLEPTVSSLVLVKPFASSCLNQAGLLKRFLLISMPFRNQQSCISYCSRSTVSIVVKYSKAKNSFRSVSFGQQVSHNATCSLRYERHGQRRTTPGLAARQLNSNGWLCSWHLLLAVSSEGARILSRNMVELHRKLFLKINKTLSFYDQQCNSAWAMQKVYVALLTKSWCKKCC